MTDRPNRPYSVIWYEPNATPSGKDRRHVATYATRQRAQRRLDAIGAEHPDWLCFGQFWTAHHVIQFQAGDPS